MPQSPVESLIDHARTRAIKDRARQIGFDLVGIASAQSSSRADYFRQWLNEGQAGEMRYLADRFDERTNPVQYLPGARSVICVGVNYFVELEPVPPSQQSRHGKIARYALGNDYHDLLKSRLHALADWMRQTWPDVQTRACVDTAPVMEKDLATRAGVGWLGKNTCVINPRIGSWILLGEVLTTAALTLDEPAVDHCGSCTRCIDACPTAALTGPYQLDARKCISYLTIEHRDEIAAEIKPMIGDWLYGCDICQDVCPHNRKAPSSKDPAMQPRFTSGGLNVDEVITWSDEQYRSTLRGSAMKRAKLPILKRNANIVADNLRASVRQKNPGEP